MKIPVCDFSRNSKACEELKEYIQNFQNHENYLKVLVEVKNSGLNENDLLFRIVGEYQHV